MTTDLRKDALGLARLPSIRPYLLLGGIILWAVVTAPFAVHLALAGGRGLALLALCAGPIAWLLRTRPWIAGLTLVVGATVLRLSFIGLSSSDQPLLSQLALERALSGEDPYGAFRYSSGSAYAYGPLGLLWYQGGIPLEFVATLATSALLIWARAWMTLALFNAWPQFLFTPMIGYNDYSVGFVLALALVLLRSHKRAAMVLLAVAIAIKPYAAAWFIPAIGYVGLGAAALAGLGVSLLFWAPVLLAWGVPSFVASARDVEADRGPMASMYPSWSVADLPMLRLLAVPISLGGLVVRSWAGMALLGSLAFLVFLGFAPWAHAAYVAVVVPVMGLVLEGRLPQPLGQSRTTA